MGRELVYSVAFSPLAGRATLVDSRWSCAPKRINGNIFSLVVCRTVSKKNCDRQSWEAKQPHCLIDRAPMKFDSRKTVLLLGSDRSGIWGLAHGSRLSFEDGRRILCKYGDEMPDWTVGCCWLAGLYFTKLKVRVEWIDRLYYYKIGSRRRRGAVENIPVAATFHSMRSRLATCIWLGC